MSVAQRIGTARFLAGLSLHMCSVAASVGLGPSHVLTSGSSFVNVAKNYAWLCICVIVCLSLFFPFILDFVSYHFCNPKLITLDQE